MSTHPLAAALGLCLVTFVADAGTLKVRVLDGRDDAPLAGAFVQVGTSPGFPFPGNGGTTGPEGTITFVDPAVSGWMTVTAASGGFARSSVLDAVADSVTLRLHRAVPDAGIYGPSAEVSGTVTNVATSNNDGNFDIAIVYPAITLGDLAAQRALPIQIPSDTVTFPVIGDVVLPGNVVLPSQTEFVFFNFSKPTYHFTIRSGTSYDFLALAGRLPVSAVNLPPEELQNAITMREIGAERNVAVNGPLSLTINSDLNLTNNLTVNVPEAPNGTDIQVASVADIAGGRTLFFDSKQGLADTQDSFVLSGRNSSGDLSDAVPYVFGMYADSAADPAFEAGRVDRTPLTLPATRTVGDFFLIPDLAQDALAYTWSDVARPGITPDPTWASATFRVGPVTPGDPAVVEQTVWEVLVAAGAGSFALPVLPSGAPGGIPVLDQTPEADRLIWSQLVSDPSGGLQEILDRPFATATRWSRREVTVVPSTVGVAGALAVPGLALEPNPAARTSALRWAVPPAAGTEVRWSLHDAGGRSLGSGRAVADGGPRGGIEGLPDLSRGTYWLRIRAAEETGVLRFVVAR